MLSVIVHTIDNMFTSEQNFNVFQPLLIVIAVALLLLVLIPYAWSSQSKITSFEECVARGFPVMESYPRQCRTFNGDLFAENIGNEIEKSNLIKVDSPRPNTIAQSPLRIAGQARGVWYFEASFPVILEDGAGNILAQVPAQAKGEWMTEDFVPFAVVLDFQMPTTSTVGVLRLKKDNPSGLPQNDDELIIPVKFR